MILSKAEQTFIEINKSTIEGLIKKCIEDFSYMSVHTKTPEDRENARNMVLLLEHYQGVMNDLLKREIKKLGKEFTGV
jgi:hypothetical protein